MSLVWLLLVVLMLTANSAVAPAPAPLQVRCGSYAAAARQTHVFGQHVHHSTLPAAHSFASVTCNNRCLCRWLTQSSDTQTCLLDILLSKAVLCVEVKGVHCMCTRPVLPGIVWPWQQRAVVCERTRLLKTLFLRLVLWTVTDARKPYFNGIRIECPRLNLGCWVRICCMSLSRHRPTACQHIINEWKPLFGPGLRL
jgi:hypothetical protein